MSLIVTTWLIGRCVSRWTVSVSNQVWFIQRTIFAFVVGSIGYMGCETGGSFIEKWDMKNMRMMMEQLLLVSHDGLITVLLKTILAAILLRNAVKISGKISNAK